MRTRPDGVEDSDLRLALAKGWRIDPAAMTYAPVGGGSYHWTVRDGADACWFVTVDDLGSKPWLGSAWPAVLEGLRAAMDAAVSLRDEAGLKFVVAPAPTVTGQTLLSLDDRYVVSVFPFLRGVAGESGAVWPQRERNDVIDMLAALHQSRPKSARLSPRPAEVPYRDALEREAAPPVRRMLRTFDQLAAQVTGELVVTHGEPHPANIMLVDGGRMLIDWDTVGLAVPERDLWLVLGKDDEGADRYTRATGRPVDPAALELYRLRWALDDIACLLVRR